MNKFTIIIILSAFILVACQESQKGPEDTKYVREDLPVPDSSEIMKKVSYMHGYELTKAVQLLDSADQKIYYEYLVAGAMDGMSDTTPMFTEKDIQEAIQVFQKMQMEADKKRYNQKRERLSKLGEEFKTTVPKYLEENLKKEGWKETESGLQYKVINKTDGPLPQDNHVVSANLKGELISGDVFENTFPIQQPLELPIEGLEKGMREALKMMPVGSHYKFVIPPRLAFGDRGRGNSIPPNSALVMEIELKSIISTVDEYTPSDRPPMPPPGN